MRVLFITPVVPWPPRSGDRVRTLSLLRALPAAAPACEVHLLSVDDPRPAAGARRAIAPHVASFERFARDRPTLKSRLALPRPARWFHSSALRERVHERVAGEAWDVVHVDELWMHRVLPRTSRTPLVVHHHKLDLEYARATHAAPHELFKLRRLENEACRRTPFHVLCGAPDAARLASRHPALQCRVVPNGASLEGPAPGPERRVPGRLLFVGSLDYPPNVDAVLRLAALLPRIRRRHPRTHLWIVGARPDPRLSELAVDGLRLVGEVQDLAPLWAEAAALVVPLRVGGGSRLKICEALAAGCPVVSTRIGAEGLALEHGRHLLVADDEECFVNCVRALLDDPQRGAILARAGRERVAARHSWPGLGARLARAWEHAARTRPRTTAGATC